MIKMLGHESPSPDLAIGAFTARGPWIVDPAAMPWRTAIDLRREQALAQVPKLLDRRRMPGVRLFGVGAKLGLAVGRWAVGERRHGEVASRKALAARLRRAFEDLGPTYIKLGQIVASAEGMLPAELVQEFKLCRDQVAPESFDTIREVIEADLGQPLHEFFAEFDRNPLAAASIAQVHVARLLTGEEVVVKVQRPAIGDLVPRDLQVMSWIAPLVAKRAPQAAIANLPAYIELFAETISEELDFRLEAENMLDIARVLATTGQRAVVIPRPHPELVTRRVLVMERLHGFKIDDSAGMQEAGIDPTGVFRSLMVCFFEGAGIHGVFHGDLHGGNMIVTPEGKAGIFDFGITGRFSDSARIALMTLLLGGLTQDVRSQITAFRDLGGFPADADVDLVMERLNIEQLMTQRPGQVSPDEMAVQMRQLVTQLLDLGARLPKSLFLFIKGMIYLNGAIAALAADVDMLGELGQVFTYFSETHGDTFVSDFGVDLSGISFDDAVREQWTQIGIEQDEVVTYRRMQEINNDRVAEMRTARKRGQ